MIIKKSAVFAEIFRFFSKEMTEILFRLQYFIVDGMSTVQDILKMVYVH